MKKQQIRIMLIFIYIPQTPGRKIKYYLDSNITSTENDVYMGIGKVQNRKGRIKKEK